jgi:hypothetical protein
MPKKHRAHDEEAWSNAKKICRLNTRQVEMARRLGMNPKKLPGLRPNPQQRWKLAVGEFIEDRYRKQFGGDPHDHYLYGPERVSDAAGQAGDLVCYLMNLADGLQKWLAQGRVSAVLPQVIVELRKIAEALESGAPISPITAIPLPPRPSGRVFSKQDDLESALDDEIPF